MQIDSEFAAVIGVASSVISSGVGYGILKEKVRRLERELEKSEERYVTLTHFNDVVEPIRRAIESVQKDVKEILSYVSGRKA